MSLDSQEKQKASEACQFCLDEDKERPLVSKTLPFPTRLSLEPLIEFWDQQLASNDLLDGLVCPTALREQIQNAPELRGPIDDRQILSKYEPLIRKLASALIPPATWETDLRALVGVFDANPVLTTPAYRRMVPDVKALPKANIDPQLEYRLTILYGYSMILSRVYGLTLEVDYPIVRTTIDPQSGLPIHLQVEVDSQFVKIEALGDKPRLSDEELDQIQRSPADLELIARLLPPDRFQFSGFVAIHALDVTDQTLLSDINQQLLESQSIVCTKTISDLQGKLRSLFRSPDLELGLAAFKENELLIIHSADPLQEQCIFGDSLHFATDAYEDSPHQQAALEKKTIVVPDLRDHKSPSTIEQDLLEAGFRNIAIAPLIQDEEVIGMIELKSPTLGTLNSMNAMKVRELLPSFKAAMQRSLREFQNKVDGVIKRECTVIHPTVEWRFREAAAVHLEGKSPSDFGQQTIAFGDVYPLYGASDIRNSSRLRNRAISDDLGKELTQVIEILRKSPSAFPLQAQSINTCSAFLDLTKKEIRASDEYRITEYLQKDVHELLTLIRDREPSLRQAIEEHLISLDPQHGTIFETRKGYMDSVAQLNTTFGKVLDQAQEDAQSIYPHYFEKHSTDGVDFTLYIGESLCQSQPFHPLYLENLRLWQLIVMCDLACAAHALKGQLPIPLDTTHLIAVQDHPVSVRFRFDERIFDVDGAYNARYEIMKKRIDKAMVRGRTERLTQPDKIAIVYSSSKEAARYRNHLEYLQSAGYLIPGFEDLQLEDLQGVEGLRAMRVTVNLNREPRTEPLNPAENPTAAPAVW